MAGYYVQKAGELFPIYGSSSFDEAKGFVDEEETIIASNEDVYMNPYTGSVDFESGWDNLEGLIEVEYDPSREEWVEKGLL